MCHILQIETSTTCCSVAIAQNGHTLTVYEQYEQNIHASFLTIFIEKILTETSISWKDIKAVAISQGPGSYTGLRIGVSTAKGLCYALDKPLIAIDTLKGMANQIIQTNNYNPNILLCPMIDARRMEVYTALFDWHLNYIEDTCAKIIDNKSFIEILKERSVVFFGDGMSKCKIMLENISHAIFHEEFVNSASGLSQLAYEHYKQKKFEDLAYFEPFYLKDFFSNKV